MDILYTAGEDDDLSRTHLGTLVLFHIHGPLVTADALSRYTQVELDLLIERGYLEQNKALTLYKIKGMADDENEIKAMWNTFYVAYPGAKTGAPSNLKYFRKKWKAGNRWRSILPTLNEALQRQIGEREAVTRYNEQVTQSGQSAKKVFLPDWKNLETYINNASWDEHRPVPAAVQAMPAAPAPVSHTPVEDGDVYGKYKEWALKLAEANKLTEAYACSLLPLRTEFDSMMDGKTLKPFISWWHYTTIESLKSSVRDWTKEFFSNTLLRSTHALLLEYYSKKYREKFLED